MAINVDSVYKTVLYLLNKEQRGYIQPDEFNRLATQVQKEVFEEYFSDANQLIRKDQSNVQNDSEFFNHTQDIEYKLYPFRIESNTVFTYDVGSTTWTSTENVYKVGDVIANYTVNQNPNLNSVAELCTIREYNTITRSKLTAPTKTYPLFYVSRSVDVFENTASSLKVFPLPDSLTCNVLTTPTNVYWGYSIGSVNQFVYNSSLWSEIQNPLGSLNFQLDISEQTNVIIRILKYCGVIINNPQVVAMANSEIQQSNLNLKS